MFRIPKSPLALTKFKVESDAPNGPALEIIGRPKGLKNWLLSMMKLSPLTTMKLEGEEMSLKTAGLRGEIHTMIPLTAVHGTECGFVKIPEFLYLAAILLIWGIFMDGMGAFVLMALLAAGSLALYVFTSSIFLTVQSGDVNEEIWFSKGVLDGEPVDIERALQAASAITTAVLRATASGNSR